MHDVVKSLLSSRLCFDLLDVSSQFKPEVRHQGKNIKIKISSSTSSQQITAKKLSQRLIKKSLQSCKILE